VSCNRRVLADTPISFCLQVILTQPIPSPFLSTLVAPTTPQTEQAKHWEEVKALKDSEAMLLEECERINQVCLRLYLSFPLRTFCALHCRTHG
jgi:hypothetical protein